MKNKRIAQKTQGFYKYAKERDTERRDAEHTSRGQSHGASALSCDLIIPPDKGRGRSSVESLWRRSSAV